jgi:superfamily II DNA helicase RecQ
MAASKGKGVFDYAEFSVAISTACALLNVETFYPDQEEALCNFFKGKDLFFSAHTGYGKSLIFQAIPIIADVLNDQAICTSTVLVISPLLSLMKDQVNHINNSFGISAAAIFDGQDDEVLKNIEEGVYSLVYTSPECFVGKKRWRTLASSQTFREDCIAVVIDEAHCLVHW